MFKKTLSRALLFCIFSTQVFAQEYAHQLKLESAETFESKTQMVNFGRDREESYQTTCFRDVIDGYDTQCQIQYRSRLECPTIPAHTECRDVMESVCRNEPRTTRQCTPGPTRRECKPGPTRRVCDGPSIPSTPSTPSNPSGPRGPRYNPNPTSPNTGTRRPSELSEKSMDSQCRDVPGPEICTEVRGPEICQNVHSTERVCQNVPRRQCEIIPAQTRCHTVEYPENVCQQIPRYRSEAYACTKVRTVTDQFSKRLVSEVLVRVDGQVNEKLSLEVKVKPNRSFTGFGVNTKLLNSPQAFLALNSESVEILEENENEIVVYSVIELSRVAESQLEFPLPVSIKSASSDKRVDSVELVVLGDLSNAVGSAKIKFMHKNRTNYGELIGNIERGRTRVSGTGSSKVSTLVIRGDVLNNVSKLKGSNMSIEVEFMVQGTYAKGLLNEKAPEKKIQLKSILNIN